MQVNKPLYVQRETEITYNQNDIQKHIKNFQRSIRQGRVESERSQIRRSLLLPSSEKPKYRQQSYLTSVSNVFCGLSNISLQRALENLGDVNEHGIADELALIDQIAKQFLAYIDSSQQNHFFELISLQDIQKLARLIRWTRIPLYQPNPRIFLRIVMILERHTRQCEEVPLDYLDTLESILKHLQFLKQWPEGLNQFLYLSHPQLKQLVQLVFVSLSNISLQRQEYRHYFVKPDGILNSSLLELNKLVQYLRQHQVSEDQVELKILNGMVGLCQSFFQFQGSGQCRQGQSARMLDIMFQMVNSLLQILSLCSQRYSCVQENIANALKSLFYQHLTSKPEIVISHDFTILFRRTRQLNTRYLDLNRLYSKELIAERKASLSSLSKQIQKTQQLYLNWLCVIEVIFGLNIPSQDEQTYEELFDNWVTQFLVPIFSQILSSNLYRSNKIVEVMLGILLNLCLEEVLLEKILDELPILNKIFYFAQSSQSTIKQRRNSLKCIANMLRVTLDGHSCVRDTVMELVSTNRVIGTLADLIGSYVDVQLNLAVLQALQLLLESETCERNEENRWWLLFCEQGGRVRMENMIGKGQGQKTKELDMLAEAILNTYSGDDI